MRNPLYDSLFGPHEGRTDTFISAKGADDLSYGGFMALAHRIAGALDRAGLTPGDRLALQVHKSVEALAVYAACAQSGIVFLPLNISYTPAEVEYFIADAGAALLVADPAAADALADIAGGNNTTLLTLGATGDGTLMEAARTAEPVTEIVERSADDLAAILYTSGTTGRSKGAMISHQNLLSNAKSLVTYWQFTADDVLLHALPIFHTHGLFVATNVSLLAGCRMIFQAGFKIDDVIDALPDATTMMGVPTFYTRLLADPRMTAELVSHMRLFISGSAPLLAETHTQFEKLTGQRILERYGMTETNMITSNPYEGERRAGTVGFPLPDVSVRIADPDTGAPVAAGDVGMIEVSGPNVFSGYWNMPEKTKAEFREDGFFITGDMGQLDDGGYLQIVGRSKDLIISGGYNIYPKELELLLDDQPGVLESAVIGVPHPDFGEGVVGVLVAEPGDAPDPDQIMGALTDQVARFKQPKKLLIIDELPRNTMGKVQKNVLRDRYRDLLVG